jgi:TPR repeat protein
VNIGNTFEALNDFENARRSYKNAIQWFEEISSSSGIALAKLNLALVYEKEVNMSKPFNSISKH